MHINDHILISGGSGLIGSHLIPRLEAEGDNVSILSRKAGNGSIKSFQWNPTKGTIDENAFTQTTAIVHLAGAGIDDHRWTKKYKNEIITSRIQSTETLVKALRKTKHQVHTVVAASAIGYYGDQGDVWVDENFHPADDFMGNTCVQWEKASKQFETLGIRLVTLRIGILLAQDGGALPAMAKPVRLFAGAPLGKGTQYLSWIHIDDLCRMISYSIKNKKIHGTFNAVAPGPVTNKFFTQQLGKTIGRPIWPLNVPAFLIKTILGEMSDVVLNGQRVSCEKIRNAGFKFNHSDIQQSLKELL